MKTIRMPQELLTKWLAALRSGEYVQTRSEMLKDADGYCCLGVLIHVSGDDVDKHTGTPQREWMAANGVVFLNYRGETDKFCNPHLPTIGEAATYANDSLGLSFPVLADAIEAAAEGY